MSENDALKTVYQDRTGLTRRCRKVDWGGFEPPNLLIESQAFMPAELPAHRLSNLFSCIIFIWV